MIKLALLRSCSSSPLLLEAKDVHRKAPSSTARLVYSSTISCSSSSSSSSSPSRPNAYIPKLQPFSRTKLERAVKEPPLIEKSENELADYCSTLEGDDSYSCWRAYFELKDLEREAPKQEVEKLILQSGGVKSLIGCLHGIAAMQKGKKKDFSLSKPLNSEGGERPFPIPDGLPKSLTELEEEERCRMPDSPYTRLLRTKGRLPAWYSQAPDHETD